MTAIVGFMNGNSAILCADSLAVIGEYSKDSVQKIQVTDYHKKWRMAIAGAATDAIYLELFESALKKQLSPLTEFDYDKILMIIEGILHQIHKKHIWPRKMANQFQTLIVIQGLCPQPSRALLATYETTVLHVDEYKAIGIGAYMADYLRRKLFPRDADIYNSPMEILIQAGVFIMGEIKQHVAGVERETRIAVFHGNGEMRWLSVAELSLCETWLDNLQKAELHLRHLIMNPSIKEGDWELGWKEYNLQIERIRGVQRSFRNGEPVWCQAAGWIRGVKPEES